MILEKKLIDSINEFSSEAFKLNYYLANNPELSGKEYESSKKIVKILNKYGIQAKTNYCDLDTAFYGKVVENRNSNINIGILTEYDALPIVGHACGHSVSASISLLSAIVFKENEEIINANIDIIGTPDEEDSGLKVPMADKGAFDKYDFVIMVHLDTKNVPNWKLFAFETYLFEFTGKSAHSAASPWDGRSALDGLMLSIHAFDMIRKSTRPGTIIEGFISEGGNATNLIPDKASGKYTFRSPKSDYISKVLTPWVRDVVEGCAKATQTEVKIVSFEYPFKDMKYNQNGTNIIKEVMNDYGLPNKEQEEAIASSDIGNVSYRCPAFHPSIAITYEDIGLHTEEFAEIVKSEKSEIAIVNGTKVIVGFVARLLENPELLKKIKEEFYS